jgi:sulfite reductase alpha subunit-like flavoprotein
VHQDELANEPGVVAFVISTYGDGEPPDNAKDFMSWILDEEREPGMLSKLKYIIFGLGNKTYEDYNIVCSTARTITQGLCWRYRSRFLILRPMIVTAHRSMRLAACCLLLLLQDITQIG